MIDLANHSRPALGSLMKNTIFRQPPCGTWMCRQNHARRVLDFGGGRETAFLVRDAEKAQDGLFQPPPSGRPFLFAAWLLCAVLAWPGAAWAHGGDSDIPGDVRTVLDELPPALAALHVELRETLAPQLLIANPTNETLTVQDANDRAFLRIGPDHVEGDLGAAAFHRSYTLMAPGAVPADASTETRWQVVEQTSNWGWFDLRLRTGSVDVAHDIVDAGDTAAVGEWSIPVRLGDTQSAITGYFEYVPTPRGMIEARIDDSGALQQQALVRALPGSSRPGVFLSYRGERPLVVMGAHGQPFLRFTSAGVDANRRSTTWAEVARPGAAEPVPATDDAQPMWARVSATPSYGWIEPRAAFSGVVDDPAEPGIVKRWQIPVRIGDRESRISGVTEWIPITPVAQAEQSR